MNFLKEFFKNIWLSAYLFLSVLGCLVMTFGPYVLGNWLDANTAISDGWLIVLGMVIYITELALVITLIDRKW